MKPIPAAVHECAAQWLARRDAGLSPAEEQALQDWLAAAPEHVDAWREVHGPWLGLDRVRWRGEAETMVQALADRARRRRVRRQRSLFAGLAAAAAIALGFFLRPPVVDDIADGHTPVVTIQSQEEPAGATDLLLVQADRRDLADGSTVELNSGALLSVSYTADRREVRLIRGEAHFTVAPDPARPFVVRTGAVEVRAIGTVFAVDRTDRAADVLVTEGKVGVVQRSEAAAAPIPLLVGAGERVLMPNEGGRPEVETVTEEDIRQRLHWRGPKLRLAGAPLAEVVRQFNRLNRLQLVIGDPALADLRFSGSFPADNIEGFVRVLAGNYGIKGEAAGHDTIVLRRQ